MRLIQIALKLIYFKLFWKCTRTMSIRLSYICVYKTAFETDTAIMNVIKT